MRLSFRFFPVVLITLSLRFLAPARASSFSDAKDALMLHDYPTALAAAQAASVDEPGRYPLYLMGLAQVKLGQIEAAAKTAAKLDQQDSYSLLLRGEIAVAQGNAAVALPLFDQVLREEPEDTDALTSRGHAHLELNVGDRGRADFDRAIELSEYSFEAFFHRGQLRARAGDTAGAARDLSRTLRQLSEHREALPLRAELYVTLKLRELALRDIATALIIVPNNSALLTLRARAEKLAPAEPTAGRQAVTALLQKSGAALARNDQSQAAAAFDLALLNAENNQPDETVEPHLYVKRGDLLAASGLMDLAKDDYRNARFSGELVPPALLRLARLEFAEKKYSDALASIHAINPEWGPTEAADGLVLGARAHLALAEESGDTGELAPGFEALKNARQLNAELPEIAVVQKELIAARKKINAAGSSRFTGEKINAALTRAHELAKEGEAKAAFALYDRLLQLNPTNPAIYEARLATTAEFSLSDSRGEILALIARELVRPTPAVPDSGDAAELALARATLAVHRKPYLSRPYVERARLRLEHAKMARSDAALLSDLKPAQADALLAVQLDAYDPQAYVALSETIAEQRRAVAALDFSQRDQFIKKAMSHADRALALAPDDVPLLIWRGNFETAHGFGNPQKEGRALRFYVRACRADPRSTKAWFAHAVASSKLANHMDAIAGYRRILQLEPDNLYARYELGVAQLYAKTYGEAVTSFAALQQTINASGDKTSADAVEIQQLHAIALAAAGDAGFETVAKDVLSHSHWIGNAYSALYNLSHLDPHAAHLDRLNTFLQTRNDSLPNERENQHEMVIDASPR